jgi:hypothetical protein
MKTPFGFSRLAGWIGRCAVALVALTICASAFADKDVVVPKEKATRASMVQTAPAKKQIYIFISGSAIPQPIDRVAGPIATTAIPMTVYGNHAGE